MDIRLDTVLAAVHIVRLANVPVRVELSALAVDVEHTGVVNPLELCLKCHATYEKKELQNLLFSSQVTSQSNHGQEMLVWYSSYYDMQTYHDERFPKV